MNTISKINKYNLYIALAAILFGFLGYFGKVSEKAGLENVDLLFWRFLVSTIFLHFIISYRNGFDVKNKSIYFKAFLLGAIGYFSQTFFFFWALDLISPGLVTVLFFMAPIFTIVFNLLKNKNIPSILQFITILLSILGCYLMAPQIEANNSLLGMFVGLCSGIFFAIYLVSSKIIVNKINSITLSYFVFFGATSSFFISGVLNSEINIPSSLETLSPIIGIVIICTILPNYLLFLGLKHVDSTVAGIITMIQPISALIIDYVGLDITITYIQLVGCFLIIIASALASIRSNHQNKLLVET